MRAHHRIRAAVPHSAYRRRAGQAVLVLAAWTLAVPAAGERLPIKVYTSAEGLAHDRVKRIVRDSRGFLWLCTLMGLSRFDGERFETYRPDRGLPYFSINDLLEARDGTYWLATNGGGVVRFDHSAATGARFVAVRASAGRAANRINALHQDAGGRIWLGTDDGLFALEGAGEAWTARPARLGDERSPHVWAFADDRAGGLWIGTSSGLVHRSATGGTTRHLPPADVWSVLLGPDGRVWAALDAGLMILAPPASAEASVPPTAMARPDGTVPLPARPGEALTYGRAAGLAHDGARALFRAADGRIWVGSAGGLSCFEGGRFHGYGRRHGLADDWILSLAEDVSGSLWLGTNSGGAIRMLRNGLVSYGIDDGLADTDDHVLGDRAGALYVATPGALALHAYAGGRFAGVRPPLRVPAAAKGGWGGAGNLAVLQDRSGEWWMPSGHAIYRFAAVSRLQELAHARPRAVYSTADGLPGALTNAILEDSRGDVWAAFRTPGAGALVRWEGPRRSLRVFSAADGIPAQVPWALADDRAGGVWAGFADGTLVRWRDGRFATVPRADPWPGGTIRALHADRRGRLWVASWPGMASQQAVLWRIDDPSADRPRLVPIALRRHIGSGICLTEDRDGRIYVGGSQGVMRVTPDGAHTRYYTTADGLAANEVSTAFCDRAGVLWFGTTGGVSRLLPTPEQAASPVGNVLISRLTLAGVPYPVSDLGARSLSGLRLRPDQNTLGFEFLTLAFGEEVVRYQYRMEGAESGWSAATEDHAVRYAGLAPGSYRFLVRAVDADGRGGEPASVSFVVVPPLWRRPWFVALAGLALAGVAYAGYRVRLAHLLAVERVRTRIATDLHDDLGSSLSRVVILSEVARRQVDGQAEARALLEDIGGTARTLIDATADIIWSIDPRRDAVGPLAARVREFAGGLFAGGAASVRVHADPEVERVHLDPGQRRQLYLLLKEALNNAARHASCREVVVRLAVHGRVLLAEVRDDGRGLAAGAPAGEPPARGGHGLPSMRERAAALGGTLTIESAPGQGTVLRVEVPI
jgi:signal transduction histidine kinase/ligand-binding sensor domain-containing protein